MTGTTAPPSRRTPRGRRQAAALLAVVLAVCGVVGVIVVRAVRASSSPTLAPAVRTGLAEGARDALEAGAVKSLTPERGVLACAVRVLGAEPAEVTRVGDARTVFVWARCAVVRSDVGTEFSVPVAVHLTVPPTGEVPDNGSENGPSTRRIFPERVWGAIDDGHTYTELEAQLKERVLVRSRR